MAYTGMSRIVLNSSLRPGTQGMKMIFFMMSRQVSGFIMGVSCFFSDSLTIQSA